MVSNNSDNEIKYLHGDLHLKIVNGRCLPTMVSGKLLRCFTALDCGKLVTSNRQWRHSRGLYVKVKLSRACVAETRWVISNSQNPVWNQNFKIPLAHPASVVDFEVKEDDIFEAKSIGVATVLAKRIATGEVIDDWFQVKGTKPDAAIRLQMAFVPCYKNPIYLKGIRENYGLKESYFPWRHRGKVTLYQDAHVTDGMLPEIKLDDGRKFEHRQCWEDMCHAILEAKFLVYIMGWSIYHKVRLVREPPKPLPNGRDFNLGELLKYKSQEGVRVLLLVSGYDNRYIREKKGVMRNHDRETRQFFQDSSVTCLLSSYYVRSDYTHHQKCVIVDTQDHGSDKRKISAFIGGLDLCYGRYDTPEHRLFRDLETVFEDDCHNPTISHEGKKAPRQPWHDLHCEIEGPAAYDVLTNFEQQWRKATRKSEFGRRGRRSKKTPDLHEDALVKIKCISRITSPNENPSLQVSQEDDPENWHVQIFRSIDSMSSEGFPEDAYGAEEENLALERDLAIDRSIQMAYIQAIRSAKHFIYIENQYFMGSSFAWPSRGFADYNLIPMELALKIVSKIRAKERFTVYVVIPMCPEGNPTSLVEQQILYFQEQTMQMMYTIIAQEIKSAQLENAHPIDYLNFYCLGNREELPGEEPKVNVQTSSNGDNDLASKKFGRFMIYVHSKGMIVDDEYVILGSADIWDWSMIGTGNTEIAMGAYQPHYTWNEKREHPRGQVYGYRMSLWSEHIGTIEDCFKDPKNLDCVKYVNDIAKDNWKRYTSNEFTPLQGHILKYPVDIDVDGNVKPLPGHENFPDVNGKVLGSRRGLGSRGGLWY